MNKTLVLKVDPEAPDKKSISQAADVIRKGGLVAFPTETVYGLGANARDEKAVARLYKVKERPRSKPFAVQIADPKAINDVWRCRLSAGAEALAAKFWPGPLTLVLKSAAGENIGFRMPKNNIALALLRGSGVPIAAPSANISGSRPPTTAGEVLKELDGKIDLLLDGGAAEVGVESTVVDMTASPAKILREGAISRQRIFSALNSKF